VAILLLLFSPPRVAIIPLKFSIQSRFLVAGYFWQEWLMPGIESKLQSSGENGSSAGKRR
jgi:hypothetical protein